MNPVLERIAALYWDPTDVTSAEEKEDTVWSVYCDSLNQDSPHCKQDEPFKGRKSSIVERIVVRVATDETLAISIGHALRRAIFSGGASLFPANSMRIFDTDMRGIKGHIYGYMSFGLVPLQWEKPSDPQHQKVLASGSTLLIWGSYDPEGMVKSTKPPPGSDVQWSGNQQMENESIIMNVYAGYYNKLKGGKTKFDTHIGRVVITFDDKENASIDIEDPDSFRRNLQNLIDTIQLNPDTPRTQPIRRLPPPRPTYGAPETWDEYTSLDAFYEDVYDFGIEQRGGFIFGPWDVNRLLVNLKKENPTITRRDIIKELTQRGITYDESFKPRMSFRRSSQRKRCRPLWV
jgi:hypothetical protein